MIGLAVALEGCGATAPHHRGPSPSAVRSAFRGSAPALSALHDQADRLLGGGPSAFRARLRSLRGHPAVVNEWGSWCEPCQSEFPVFQTTAVRYGRTVAFLGIDARDTDAGARSFLGRFPLTYPSYVDPRQTIVATLRTYPVIPQTFYFNARGIMVDDHAGPYESVASLEHDIRFYLKP